MVAFFITFQGSLYTSDFHLLNLGLFKLVCSCLRLVSHHTATPVLSDLIEPLIEVSLNSLAKVGKVILVFWFNSSEAQYCGGLLVYYLTQPKGTKVR